ncbi:OLC1v1005574C1 [Oldenlandia corymbosa var. corymbosa]|uniref:OLC1v1005574C1 n=1 Tax=Oldenlandia corymbosa var. corymbosa TaxID=529605 RepID=A0AAV1DEY1_OLDCO|nr:OLC1v1005574C1 [Oldenlandia corymbosa var. corymbosa]
MANNNEQSPEREDKRPGCCISHLFHYAALKSPDKVAVIHASGGAKLMSQQPRNNYAGDGQTSPSVTINESIESQTTLPESSSSPQPPVYEGDKCFTYSDIHRAVDVLSSRLRRILDGADDPHLTRLPQSEISSSTGQRINFLETKYIPRRIAIYMEPSVEYIVGVLSVLRCGEAFMPLDPSWPKERILSVVSSSRADHIIGCKISGDDKYFHQLDKLNWLLSSGHCPVLCISMIDFAIQHDEFCDLPWPCQPEVSRLFSYLMHTSGSTGKPKGICGTEADVCCELACGCSITNENGSSSIAKSKLYKTLNVPIGLPLYNCDVVLVREDAPGYGEICVQGLCNAAGYYDHPSVTPLSYVEMPDESRTYSNFKHQYYFKTGDFARQLDSGVLIFVGREDRTIKFNGQRIALEEIESTLIEHPNIVNAAVVCQKNHEEVMYIEAHVVRKPKEDSNEHFKSLIRSWMYNKVPQAVVPSRVICAKSLPISSGKVDYNRLLRSSFSRERSGHTTDEIQDHDLLEAITKVVGLTIIKIFLHVLFLLSGFSFHVIYMLNFVQTKTSGYEDLKGNIGV